MKKLIIILAAMLIISAPCFGIIRSATSGYIDEARSLVKKSLEAMGGEEKIRALSSLRVKGIGHNFAVEQSERPEGPSIVAYQQIDELRDLTTGNLFRKTNMRQGQIPDWREMSLIVAANTAAYKSGEREFPGRVIEVEDAEIKLALAPEKIFLNALLASDLRMGGSTVIHEIRQKVIRFTHKNTAVAIYLNSNTNLPTAVETVSSSNNDYFWSIWGDVTTRTYYSYWMLEPGGIRYPRQSDIVRNGYQLESFTVTDLGINDPIDAKTFAITDETKKAFAAVETPDVNSIPLGVADRPESEVVPGIFEIPGRWDIAFVEQKDGVVIIEAPISSGYSEKAIDEAKRRFPNKKIKGVITTSDAFPHLGGIREYAAREIPIYALDLNRTILEKMMRSPHKIFPDNLERNSKDPQFNFVSKKTVIGDGANRLEMYPIRSESGERMMMIYFPEHNLLYSSDLIQKFRNGKFFMPQYLSEVIEAARRENLKVNNVFGMHISKTSWSEITDAVDKQTTAPEAK